MCLIEDKDSWSDPLDSPDIPVRHVNNPFPYQLFSGGQIKVLTTRAKDGRVCQDRTTNLI